MAQEEFPNEYSAEDSGLYRGYCKKISLHTLDSPPPSCQHVIAHSNDPMLQLYSLLHNSKTHASRVFQLLLEVDE